MRQERFGDVLSEFRGKAPVKKLAQAISVDASVVYRWLRNERVPPLNTDHLSSIARYFELSSFETERLKQAQINSLSHISSGARRRKRKSRSGRIAVNRFIAETASKSDSSPRLRQPDRRRILPHPLEPTTVRGADLIVRAAIELIAHAQPDPRVENPTILLSLQGVRFVSGLPATRELLQDWRQALREAQQRGWQIEQLWRLDRNIDRSLYIVQSTLEFIAMGRYYPRYFDHYGLAQPPCELVIVPGYAAMLLLAARNPLLVDEALVLTDAEQIDTLTAHYGQLRQHTNLLLKVFLLASQGMEFTRALVSAEARPGGRMSSIEGLSGLTHPPKWLSDNGIHGQSMQRAGIVSAADVPDYLSELRRRLVAFEEHVQQYDYLDICPQQAVHQLVQNGMTHPHMPGTRPISLAQRLELIERIIILLQSYEHYHLALLDEDEARSMPANPAITITGESDVFIGAVSRHTPGRPMTMQVQITEATIVAAFREHFMDMWERIAPPHRQKAWVLGWLKQQAEQLRRRMQSASGV